MHAPRAAAIAAKNHTDMDMIRIVTNVECYEGQFDAWGTFRLRVMRNPNLGGAEPIGACLANLGEFTRPHLLKIALSERVRTPWQVVEYAINAYLMSSPCQDKAAAPLYLQVQSCTSPLAMCSSRPVLAAITALWSLHVQAWKWPRVAACKVSPSLDDDTFVLCACRC